MVCCRFEKSAYLVDSCQCWQICWPPATQTCLLSFTRPRFSSNSQVLAASPKTPRSTVSTRPWFRPSSMPSLTTLSRRCARQFHLYVLSINENFKTVDRLCRHELTDHTMCRSIIFIARPYAKLCIALYCYSNSVCLSLSVLPHKNFERVTP